jgi:hypothetical protein
MNRQGASDDIASLSMDQPALQQPADGTCYLDALFIGRVWYSCYRLADR